MSSGNTLKQLCPQCGSQVRISAGSSGRTILCPKCAHRFVVKEPVTNGDGTQEPGQNSATTRKGGASKTARPRTGKKRGEKPRHRQEPARGRKGLFILVGVAGAVILGAGVVLGIVKWGSRPAASGQDPVAAATGDQGANPGPQPSADSFSLPRENPAGTHASTGAAPIFKPGPVTLAGKTVTPALAAELPKEQLDFFEKKIRPVLTESCYKCHSAESGKSRGGLKLDTHDAMLAGGNTGPALVPGDPAKSLLVKAIGYRDKDLQMPPDGKKLPDQQIADLTQWVKIGAPDPRMGKAYALSGLTDKARQHWAYQPMHKPPLPTVKNSDWVASPVDAFILQKLEAHEMTPAPGGQGDLAPPRDLRPHRPAADVRRRSSVSTRTSRPTPLPGWSIACSPRQHYGERWGRYWLDVARYADTKGDRRPDERRLPVSLRLDVSRLCHPRLQRGQALRPLRPGTARRRPAWPIASDQRDLAALGFITVGHRSTAASTTSSTTASTSCARAFLA